MSSKPDPGGRVAELIQRLNRYSHLYYVEGRSEISDEEYDLLYRELGALEEAHPELVSSDSPTQRVGAPLPEGQGFEKVPHAVPMLSIESLFTRDEVSEFFEKIQRFLVLDAEEDLDWQVEPKFDGVSASLIYERGRLTRAVTRGDGRVGEDVTANLRTVRNLPLRLSDEVLSVPELLEVRGEILIARERFLAFNREREAQDEPVLANARNAAAGALRRNDPAMVARYPLEFHFYAAPRIEGGPTFETNAELSQALRDWGLPDSGFGRTVTGLSACFDYHDEFEAGRDDLPFEVDGVVCKLDRLDLRERLGSTSRATRWQFAHKFAAVEAVSRLRAIEVQVGANGRLTPRAHVEPVEVLGVTVRHATLHNADHVASLGVRVGDQVFLKRAGDVIPKITGVASAAAGREPADWAASLPESLVGPESGELRPAVMCGWREEFSMPTTCPACGTSIVIEGKHVRCPNLYECRPQVVGRTLLLTGRGGFEIDSIGEKMVEQLVQAGLLEGPADLFHLAERQGELVALERWGLKTVENLLAQLEARRRVPFARFLASLAIPDVGSATGRLLAAAYKSLEELRSADEEDLQHIDGIGPEVAAKIVSWFGEARNQAFLQRLFSGGVELTFPTAASGGTFEGQTVVFTGTLKAMGRAEAKQSVEEQGGRVASSVSSRTDFLVQGGKPGSKARKAAEAGVSVLLEEQFLARVRRK